MEEKPGTSASQGRTSTDSVDETRRLAPQSDDIGVEDSSDAALGGRIQSGGLHPSNSPDKRVHIAGPEPHSYPPSSSSTSSLSPIRRRISELISKIKTYFLTNYAWIPQNFTWSKLKPVIRCAVSGWVSIVLFVILKVQIVMGSASFLILIAAFLSAPADPFIAAFEREFLFLFMCSLIWAWSCLGIFFANLSRKEHVPHLTIAQVIDGRYVEAGPSVIIAIWLFFGSAFLLWLRASRGPGPFLFPTIIACLAMDICLTTAALFPFPFYLIGRSVLVPLSIHSGVALLASIFVFPSTLSALFTARLSSSLTPVLSTFADHLKLLGTPLTSANYSPLLEVVRKDTRACETVLVALAASGRLLKNDLIYARFGPKDFLPFQGKLKRLAGRIDGLGVYFFLINPERERFPGTSISTPGPPLPALRGRHFLELLRECPSKTHSTPRSHLQLHDDFHSSRHHHHRHPHRGEGLGHIVHHRLLHSSLLSLARARAKKAERAVGTFESQRYLNLESTRLWDPNEDDWNEKIQLLLKTSCTPLLEACSTGVNAVRDWLSSVRKARPTKLREELQKREERVKRIRDVRDQLANALETFRVYERHAVLEPYRPSFEEGNYNPPDTSYSFKEDYVMPPHRCLFNCFLYQYNLMQITSIILEMLDEILLLEDARPHCQFWTPMERMKRKKWAAWSFSEPIDATDEDYDPDANPRCATTDPRFPSKITGPAFPVEEDLGLPQRRDPEHLPPRNVLESVAGIAYLALISLGTGNVLFAIKGGLLSVALALPGLLKSSAQFAYENRFLWAIFMGQMGIARFQGDTTFALSARITSTFFGAAIGLVMWYISCGSGAGNPFGLAAVCAVCFPFFFYARLYWPIPLLRNFVFFVTISLVIGYSYQDARLHLPGNPGFGWPVAWKRFLAVTCGVTAAFIASFFPPATTIRRYQRQVLATSSLEMGNVYCAVLSFANTKYEPEIQEIISTLMAVRNKLTRVLAMRANIAYEFSFQGRWPADRYQKIVDLQMGISYGLSHLMSVLEHMEPAWSRAFLRRTRFIDPDFQGDVLGVVSMITFALRTGTPLPQITPCPLVDRFTLKFHGLNVIHKESEEDYGLPRTLSIDTLKDEQYLMFCVGIAMAFSFISRLDRLMVAVKEVVGEQYHIHGVGVFGSQMPHRYSGSIGLSSAYGPRSAGGVSMGSRTNTVHFDPPTQV
ncbi:hypothetical protein CPB84DRAFT_1682022 [Gymnopilus junonius]|uniref:DUF2421 domain-containing protein n=1 Tax=Gymnopilus junonius TaxID=109634 RepID=A0A9P5TME1_GYMJU|nr:hypothetical protein CPB84DRAFT_1682022 [Gymnopilus junonius]